MRWDLVTRFEVLKKGDFSRAVKEYQGDEDFFKYHFPGKPRVPQAFLIEMIAQAGGVLFGLSLNFQKEIILAKIEEAEFFSDVKPPCQLVIEARIGDEREDGAWISGTVSCGEKEVAKANILLAVVDTLIEGKKNIVFNEAFMKKYQILEIARQSQALGASS